MDTVRIDKVILGVRSGWTDSEKILNRAAGLSQELRGEDWHNRSLRTDHAREVIITRSRDTALRLQPHLKYIAAQIPGFSWAPTQFRPNSRRVSADGTSRGHVKFDLEFGERKWDGPHKFNWRSGSVEFAGRKIKVSAYDAEVDDGARNVTELVRLDGSILVVNSGRNVSALGRVAEYIAALGAEGLTPNRHWRRENYEEIHGAEIKTPQWAHQPRAPVPQHV
jgi:hypothetical protein